jgi:hypothetical protein
VLVGQDPREDGPGTPLCRAGEVRGPHALCQEVGGPNISECWEDREATFLIGGDQCTRHDFCRIDTPSRVADGHRTAADVAGRMPWRRRDNRLDELNDVHGMTAILETAVHLELLADRDEILRTSTDDRDCYMPT